MEIAHLFFWGFFYLVFICFCLFGFVLFCCCCCLHYIVALIAYCEEKINPKWSVTIICTHKMFGVYHAKTLFWRTHISTVLEMNISGSSLVSSRFRFSKVKQKSHTIARTVSQDGLDSVSLLPCTVSASPASGQVSIKSSHFNIGMLYIRGVFYQQLQEAWNSRTFGPVFSGGSDLSVSLAEVSLPLTHPCWSQFWLQQFWRRPWRSPVSFAAAFLLCCMAPACGSGGS